MSEKIIESVNSVMDVFPTFDRLEYEEGVINAEFYGTDEDIYLILTLTNPETGVWWYKTEVYVNHYLDGISSFSKEFDNLNDALQWAQSKIREFTAHLRRTFSKG